MKVGRGLVRTERRERGWRQEGWKDTSGHGLTYKL